jgi:UDP-N-acetylmuramyl pentapeptide synthase
MSRLDDELKNALQREEPPPGFAGRVLARVEARQSRRPWWAAAIAAAVLLAAGVEFEHQRRLRAEGEQAKERVMLALQITGSKLQVIKEKINALDSTRR